MTTTGTEAPAYWESIDCTRRDEDGYHQVSHEGPCDYRWACGICFRVLDPGPCPDHAPVDFPGLTRIECDATPPHVTFVYAHDGYPPPCPWCQAAAAFEMHRGCEHSHHGAWRAWKITGHADRLATRLGLWSLTSVQWGGGCDGCRTGFRWGPHGWVLSIRVDAWRDAWSWLAHPSRRSMCRDCRTGYCGAAACTPGGGCSCPCSTWAVSL